MRFVSGRTVTADLVVFADGITSTARERLDPTAQLTYSGYVGWRGTVPEHELTDGTRELLAQRHLLQRRAALPHHALPDPGPAPDAAGRSRATG